MSSDQSELHRPIPPEYTVYPELNNFIETTRRLHDLVNDPATREINAPKKARLIHEMAKERLGNQTEKCKVETIEALHEETGTMTHNVVVTLGDTESGPTTILMVHHDVISVPKDTEGLIPLSDEDSKLSGRTIQDNTIHLAATLESLKKIKIPTNGAVKIVFTDHEENGCRGSHALKEQLIDGVNVDYPVALIALESTQDSERKPVKVGVGHRGKLDAQIEGGIEDSVTDTFLRFYERLSAAGLQAFEADIDDLGRTSGTSTAGYIDQNAEKGPNLWAKIDFRTNSIVTPQNTMKLLADQGEIESNPGERAYTRAAELINSGMVKIEIQGNKVIITSKSNLKHPALFNPTADETTLPVLYALLAKLKWDGRKDSVNKITWGSIDKQNSNPTEAAIEFTDNMINQQELEELLISLKAGTVPVLPPSSDYQIPVKPGSIVQTGAVLGEMDDRVKSVLRAVNGEPSYLTFMTDIGAQFAELEERGFEENIYTYVFGVGNPERLHKDEEVTHEDIKWLISNLPVFINEINDSLRSGT